MEPSEGQRYLYLYPELKYATIELFVPTFSKQFNSAVGNYIGQREGGFGEGSGGVVSLSAFSAATEEQRIIQAIAEPISRPRGVHRYRITPFSLGAAVSAGLTWEDVVRFLSNRCVNWEDVSKGDHSANQYLACEAEPPGGNARREPAVTARDFEVAKPKEDNKAGSTAEAAISISTSSSDDDDEAVIKEGQKHGMGRATNALSPNITPPPRNEEERGILSCEHHQIAEFIKQCMVRYGKTTISFAADGQCYIESQERELLLSLVGDPIIGSQCKVDKATGSIRVTIHKPATTAVEAADVATVAQPPPSDDFIGGTSVVRYYRAQLLDAVACKVVSERCLKLGYPCFHDYDYRNDTSVPKISCDLKVSTQPRAYQVAAVEASAASGRCRSGVLVLPCGAGKTLVGVMLVAAVKRRTLIVCAGSVSVSQWKSQVLDFATLSPPTLMRNSSAACSSTASDSIMAGGGAVGEKGVDGSSYRPVRTGAQRIAVVTSKEKSPITEDTDIVITTYNMLSVAKKQLDRLSAQVLADRHARRRHRPEGRGGAQSNNDEENNEVTLDDIFAYHTTMSPATRSKLNMFRPFGLVVLDEVHVVPAEFFKDALSTLKTKATVGLTATFVREDHRIESLYHLIGAKLYDVGWQELAKGGYLARVMCVEVNCSITPEFGMEYSLKQKMLKRKENKTKLVKMKGAGVKREREGLEGDEEQKDRKGGKSAIIPAITHDTTPLLVMLAAANPNKMKTVLQLVAAHRNDKVLLFCDHILLLKVYAKLLNCPIVSGETSHKDRMMIFSDFQAVGGGSSAGSGAGGGGSRPGGGGCNIIAISRVGDVSVNLPSANVVIQVSSHGGSRRQEAQRLGRVLRPKETVTFRGARQKALQAAFPSTAASESTATTSSNFSSSGGRGEVGGKRPASTKPINPDTGWLVGVLDRGDAADANAYFYSLVTEYSVEVPYAVRRSEFLVDQGYPFYSVLAPSPSRPPPPAFRAKIEAGGYAGAEQSANGASRGGLRGGFGGLSSMAMAPTSIPSVTMESMWQREWCIAFLARIVSGWELRFYAAASSSSSYRLAEGSSNAQTSTSSRVPVKREEMEASDVLARSHGFSLSGIEPMVAAAGLDVAAASAVPLSGVKAEEAAAEEEDEEGASAEQLVLADDVVYAE